MRFSPVPPEGVTFAREARYHCPECTDTGYVKIFSPKWIEAVRNDPDGSHVEHTCVAVCGECTRMENYENKRGIPIFGSSAWHISVRDPQARKKAAVYKPITDHPNYYEELS